MSASSTQPRRLGLIAIILGLIASALAVVQPVSPSAAASSGVITVFDDMEHGDPFANGWFSFGGSVGGGGIGPNGADLPPGTSGSFSLETGWGSGGTPGFFGGFGRTNPTDLSGTAHFNFWINPNGGQDYTLEINLQDDDDGDDGIGSPADDEFQYNCVVSPTGPCAVAGGGWQLVSIPLADFFDDNSFLTGGNGVLDAVPVAGGGNGQLVNVVIAVIGNSGSDVNFRTDDWTFSELPQVVPAIIDDFESGLPLGTDADGNAVGWFTFSDGSPVAISTSTTPPAPVPGSAAGNTVLQMDADVLAFAGFIHAFENAAVDTWVSQDWSAREGFAFWLHGSNSGTDLFVDLLENRNPGSTTDDAERWTVTFVDDFTGWQYFEFPFTDFVRKEIGNGAPNDGLTLFEVHGWAFGTLNTGGPATYYLDDASLFGVGTVAPLAANFASGIFDITEGTTGDVTVALNRPFLDEDPDQVSVDYRTEPGTAEPGRDYTPTSGTLTFTKGGPTELTFPIETFGDDKFLGDERIVLRLTNPVDVELGTGFQASAIIVDDDPFDPKLLDDFERGAYLWDADGVSLATPEIEAGDPLAVPGQGAFEHILEATTPILVDTVLPGGNLCNSGNGVVPVTILTTDTFDATTVDHETVRFGAASESHVKKSGAPQRHEQDVDGDGDTDLVFHFRFADTGYTCDTTETLVTGSTLDGHPITDGGTAAFGRDFPISQDWTRDEALRFWYHGTGSGDEIGVTLKDNAAADPGPAGWQLAWADEFDGAAGAPPNPANWTHELGDVTPDGKNGWGNSELQYYTDDPANAATDGSGNLVVTLRQNDDPSLECYYGPCEYTSARLLTWHKAEFAYGRIESRVQLPTAGADLDGLWPAFWSLGTDIDRNPWPGAGEIDVMEWVGRIPDEIFGTIHGPGYAGGASFGGTSPLADRDAFHTFAVEWEPNEIRWYLDGALYHSATPADVAPNPWVFDKPFFLLLNFAIGGNFGGEVGDDVVFPQEYVVDYVRVYEAPDTAERFEASFVDDFVGWQEVAVPFTAFTRSADQPAGAPDDGLGLDQVSGYGFHLPAGGTTFGTMRIDQVRLAPAPPPTEVVVTNLNDGGKGSLRDAVSYVADGGTITFDPALAGGTVGLTSGPIVLSRDVAIDAGDAPGLSIDGGGGDRVLIVDAGTTATVANATMTNGFGFQLAGCVLNNGALTLDHVTVTGCTMTTDAGDFWQGGAGIYNGDGASLDLIDSTVADNNSGHDGGGVMSFLNTTTNVVRSTISGNVAGNVGGGFRLLGDATITNSTLSGNVSTAWHGGAVFLTDGVLDVDHTTITGNFAPGSAAVFVGTFGPSSATMNIGNSIVAGNDAFGCFLAPFGAGAVAINSVGNNVFSDGSCAPVGSDQVVTDALLGPLADNGGATLTHALLAGSPAVDAVPATGCPTTDQRGVARPQGAGCDAGAFELD